MPSLRGLARAVGYAVLGGLIGFTALIVAQAFRPRLEIPIVVDRSLPWVLFRGFYGIETYRGPAGFAYTHPRADIRLPGLDRNVAWTFTVTGRATRPPEAGGQELAVFCDGVVAGRHQLSGSVDALSVTAPPRKTPGLWLALKVDPAQTIGNEVPLDVGLQVLRVDLAPQGFAWPTRQAMRAAVAAGLATGFGVGLLGLGLPLTAGLLLLQGIACAVLATHGIGAFPPFTDHVQSFAIAAALVLLAAATLSRAWRRPPAHTWLAALALTAVVVVIRLLVLVHPSSQAGDSGFHLTRFAGVLEGRFFFLSDAPGGQFPYPVGLYVLASWMRELMRDQVLLLRAIAAVADAGAGLLLFLFVRRQTLSPGAAMATLVLYFATPIGFQTQARAYLTNAFAHAAATASLSLFGPAAAGLVETVRVTGFGATAALAMLSHVSSAVTLSASVAVLALIWIWPGHPPSWRRAGVWALAALVLAAGASWAVYYRHFDGLYRARPSAPAVEAASEAAPLLPARPAPRVPVQRYEPHQTQWAPGWPALASRAGAAPVYAWRAYGPGVLALAAVGFPVAWRRRRVDPVASLALCTTAVCAGFLVLGLLSPIDLRYYLAAHPAIAMLGGLGAAAGHDAGGLKRLAAWLTLAAAGAAGIAYWFSWLA